MENPDGIKKIAIEAAKEAGRYAFEHIDRIGEISHKEGFNNLVTDIDKKCEKMIIERINKEWPSHSVLAEESGEDKRDGGYQWVIDPIDGTTNYAHGFPVFCVSIGIRKDGCTRIGVVYDPSRDELFVAEKGEGAFLNDKKIKVSGVETVGDALLATGFAYRVSDEVGNLEEFHKMLKVAQAIRRAGSAAIDLCYVACGRFDGFWEQGLCPWDTAAGQLIVEEAGGVVSALDGTPYDIHQKNILATNSKLHNEMLSLLKNGDPKDF